MSKTVWTVAGIVEVVAAIAIVAIAAAMGGCDHTLETTSGGTCFMKCHWTFVAVSIFGIAGIASSVLALVGKTAEGRRFAAIGVIVVAVLAIFATLDAGIGLCGNTAMHCHQTALGVRIASVAAAICAIVQLVKADPNAVNNPKMKL